MGGSQDGREHGTHVLICPVATADADDADGNADEGSDLNLDAFF